MVIIDKEIERNMKLKIAGAIRHRLAADFISVDLIIKSEEDYLTQSANVGYITYYAAKEGIQV